MTQKKCLLLFFTIVLISVGCCARPRDDSDDNVAVVAIGVLYCGEEQYLLRKLLEWRRWDRSVSDRYAFIVVDDGCSGPRAEEIIRGNATDDALDIIIDIYEVLRDIPWNIGGARNLLMTVAGGERPAGIPVFMIDMDLQVSDDLANAVADYAATMDQATVVIDFDRVFEDRPQEHRQGGVSG